MKKLLIPIAALILVGCDEHKVIPKTQTAIDETVMEEAGKHVVHCVQHSKKQFNESHDKLINRCELSAIKLYGFTVPSFQWVDGLRTPVSPIIPCTEAIKYQEVKTCGVQNVYPAE